MSISDEQWQSVLDLTRIFNEYDSRFDLDANEANTIGLTFGDPDSYYKGHFFSTIEVVVYPDGSFVLTGVRNDDEGIYAMLDEDYIKDVEYDEPFYQRWTR